MYSNCLFSVVVRYSSIWSFLVRVMKLTSTNKSTGLLSYNRQQCSLSLKGFRLLFIPLLSTGYYVHLLMPRNCNGLLEISNDDGHAWKALLQMLSGKK